MASKVVRRHRRGVAVLAALGLLLQALSGLVPSASNDAMAASPLDALVICTPDGIRVLDRLIEIQTGGYIHRKYKCP